MVNGNVEFFQIVLDIDVCNIYLVNFERYNINNTLFLLFWYLELHVMYEIIREKMSNRENVRVYLIDVRNIIFINILLLEQMIGDRIKYICREKYRERFPYILADTCENYGP